MQSFGVPTFDPLWQVGPEPRRGHLQEERAERDHLAPRSSRHRAEPHMTCYTWGGDLRPSEEEMKGTSPALARAEHLRVDGLSHPPCLPPRGPHPTHPRLRTSHPSFPSICLPPFKGLSSLGPRGSILVTMETMMSCGLVRLQGPPTTP